MTVRALQPDGDITTTGTQFTSDKDEVAQTIKTRLRLFMTEYFRDITQGTPWYQVIMVKSISLAIKEAAIKQVILETPDVVQILTFSTDFDTDNRKYTITSQVLTSFGVVEIQQGDVT